MPRRKKQARDLTTEEAAKKLFPKKVIEEVKKQVGTDLDKPINKKDST
jgi:hypothetical protein